jgi:hypothetical protein
VSDRSNPDDDEPIFRLVVLDRGDYANVYGADPPTRPCRACRGRPLPPGPGGLDLLSMSPRPGQADG